MTERQRDVVAGLLLTAVILGPLLGGWVMLRLLVHP
jgi:hypothetical protein